MDYVVVHVPELERFELRSGAKTLGFLQGRSLGGTLLLPYIEIDPKFRGRNLSQILLKRALEQIRDLKMKVRPLCPVVAAFLRKHSEFSDLLNH